MTRLLRRLADDLRQHGQHPAFRIAAPTWDDEQQRQLRRLLDDLAAAIPPADPSPAAPQQPSRPKNERALVKAATGLWQAQDKLTQIKGGSAPARQVNRYLGDTEKALAELGLTIQDHTGDPYHPGLSLEVIVMVDDPDVTVPTVVETVQPSIYLGDDRIEMGKVIVGCPIDPEHTEEDKRA